jgi:hypothetical protein
MNKREKFQGQIALMDIIRAKSGINVVSCGHCGSILLMHRLAEEVDCLYCDRVMDAWDCPDYLYVGAEDTEEFNDENL